MNWIIKLYHNFYNKFIDEKHQLDAIMSYRVHLFLLVTIVTGLLMWVYAFLSFYFIDHISIKYLGFGYACVHITAPLAYRWKRSLVFASYVILITGGLFQLHFCLLTGGFYNSTLVWVAILPSIAGVLTNKKHALIWSIVAILSMFTVFILDVHLQLLNNYLDERARTMTQFLVTAGMIVLNSAFTLLLLGKDKFKNEILHKKALSKQNILRIVSHDISTPLSVIKLSIARAYKSFMQADFTDLEKRLKVMEKNALKMGKTIESSRALESVESGKKDLKLDSFDLGQLMDSILLNNKDMFDVKELKIIQNFNIGVQPIMGNRHMVETQVIQNIINNAIKFSCQGGVIVFDLRTFSDEMVELCIRDHGIGIPETILQNIFNPLAKTNREGTRGETGTGFGMPIAKHIMDLMGGKIIVESRVKESDAYEHGTCFKLYFKVSHKSLPPFKEEGELEEVLTFKNANS